MDNEKTILIKEEETSEMCAVPATMFLEDRFGVSWSTDCINKDPTPNLGWDQTENNNSVNALVDAILEAESEHCPPPLLVAKKEVESVECEVQNGVEKVTAVLFPLTPKEEQVEQFVEDPLEIRWRTDFLKEDPELNLEADETENIVVSSRRYESHSTRLTQATGESCGISLEESVNQEVVHNELEVDTKESMHFTIFNTHTQRWTSQDGPLDNILQCSLRGQKLHKFSCSYCLQSFVSKYRLIKHVFIHIEGVQPPLYVCKSCGEVFHSNVSLMKHSKRVECDQATRKNKCDVCGTSCTQGHHVKSHALIDAGERPHHCNSCGKSFSRLDILNRHALIHTGIRPHQCNTCGKSFAELGYLKRHTLIHTGTRPHTCNTCGKSFTRLCHLRTHALIHTGIRSHQCNTCGKYFTLLGDLKRHTLIHTGKKPHKCNTCGKSFIQLGALKGHALIHSGTRPHKCNTCGKYFTLLGDLKRHTLIHTGKKPHKCNTCGKSFTQLGSLKMHALIHTGVKPHKCNTCGKSFTQMSNLKKHALIHVRI